MKINNLDRLIIFIISILIILPSLTSYSAPNNKSILAQIVYNSSGEEPIYLLTIFNDNYVRVFSPNNIKGMYKMIKIPKKKIEKIMEKLKESRITDDKYFLYRYYILEVESDSISMEVYFKGKCYYLESRLPYIEKQVNMVVTDEGRHILEKDETKEKYIREHASDGYKKFRKTWDQCFNLLDNLYLEITGERIVN